MTSKPIYRPGRKEGCPVGLLEGSQLREWGPHFPLPYSKLKLKLSPFVMSSWWEPGNFCSRKKSKAFSSLCSGCNIAGRILCLFILRLHHPGDLTCSGKKARIRFYLYHFKGYNAEITQTITNVINNSSFKRENVISFPFHFWHLIFFNHRYLSIL